VRRPNAIFWMRRWHPPSRPLADPLRAEADYQRESTLTRAEIEIATSVINGRRSRPPAPRPVTSAPPSSPGK
jgi:hypothetical protein